MSENVVQNYGWSTAEGPNSCNYITPRVLEILDQLRVRRVLDLGAGNGTLCAEIASRGYDTVGVEYDAGGVSVARKAYPAIPFYNFGVQDDPAELLKTEKMFDAVVSTEVVEHLFSPHLLPQFAAATLKSGGFLVITTPYHGYLKNLALALANGWDNHLTPLWHGGHIKFWSRKTLTRLLSENGFEVIGFSGVGRMPYLWKSMVLVAKKV
jgi:2-polyprenyl-3-methyl-5-hydroxy-6-metoxy-1,4-benzoquinol methylase